MALRRAFETATEGLTVLEYMATHTNVAVHPNFVPDYDPAPTEPESLDSMFGSASEYEFKDVFGAFWDTVNEVWTTDSTTYVPTEVRDDIADQLALIVAWRTDYAEWEVEYAVQREIQWKTKVAIDLKAWIAPLDI